ncbi:MAG TPA: lipopolysaccharide kinase InaA family protein [Planctomycetota bacterium]|nr:lipopolysaccharide kinase InaA family protein [Planctomycetota bacterium]
MRCSAGNAYERLREADTLMWVRSDRRVMLQENDLTHFADFMACERGELINSHGWREVLRMELEGDGETRTVYLKKFSPVQLKDAVKDLLRFRRVRTNALREFDMLCLFERAGVRVPETIACGERHVLGRDRGAFVMVEHLARGRALDEVLPALRDVPRRRRLIRSLARFVRRMHDTGLGHTALYAKHLFVTEEPDGDWSVAVIDLQQAVCRRAVSRRRRGRDLATLLVSLPPGVTTPRERWRFLLEYLRTTKLSRKDLRFVRRFVLGCAGKLSRRTLYRAWRPILEHSRT